MDAQAIEVVPIQGIAEIHCVGDALAARSWAGKVTLDDEPQSARRLAP
jgi:hypothetical protein